jgi:hypothetical protein
MTRAFAFLTLLTFHTFLTFVQFPDNVFEFTPLPGRIIVNVPGASASCSQCALTLDRYADFGRSFAP